MKTKCFYALTMFNMKGNAEFYRIYYLPCFGLSMGKGSPIFQKKYKNMHHATPVRVMRACFFCGTAINRNNSIV